MSSLTSEFAEAETGVFWDIVGCPVPDELSVESVCEKIKSALADDGYGGKVSIQAYCDTEESKAAVVSAFESSGIDLVCAGVGLSRRLRMLQELASFAVHHEPSNLMLISKNVSSDSLCVLGSL
ncbi:unnamed protein product [Microthlaspi erraticum]|uniref:NYN domain-containing protein n=1 Tax=Microthlaspi erraticum TaxID=1685480 RepID=A0A6D2KWB6_9BRAS|nr:unnamed protein product [Microthlaspi erraticum]